VPFSPGFATENIPDLIIEDLHANFSALGNEFLSMIRFCQILRSQIQDDLESRNLPGISLIPNDF
jgi:hypothetical protein